MAATLLAEGVHNIDNVPVLKDIFTMGELLEQLGVVPFFDGSSLRLDNQDGGGADAPYDLVKKMRASILVLGPLLARRGKAKVSLPGGCAIGERPVDLHIAALEKMGANISVNHGYIEASCGRLKGAEINFKTVTVTGTENILMAAVLAKGRTIINNAAAEPEVSDLAGFLRNMGAEIAGDGTPIITVDGVDELSAARWSVMPDRIEAGTFMCAVAGTGGRVRLHNAPLKCMSAVIDPLVTAGLIVNDSGDGVAELISKGELASADISTKPYPGFPTDMQAQYMAIMTKASGTALIDENIFENRFMHVAELKRMGADIAVKDGRAVVRGVKDLSGAPVMASDLRASAGLVIAALMATNTSEINRVYHLDRGYQEFEKKLRAIGADIERV
jgi:UDP-N-acetylglucosamine 1-carboxyvinyltransferase